MATEDILRCPACLNLMAPFQTRGVLIDGCTHCDSLWFDGCELDAFAGPEIVETIIDKALNREAPCPCRCKSCRAELSENPNIQECLTCGHVVPRCPECACTRLVIGNFQGINLDVCPRCHGIFFDAGELQILLRGVGSTAAYAVQDLLNRARQARLEEERGTPLPPHPDPELQRTYECAQCQKVLKPSHAFTDLEGHHFYCGSCAPAHVTPVQAKLRRRRGSFEREMQSMERLNTAARSLRMGSSGSSLGIFWILSTIFGHEDD